MKKTAIIVVLVWCMIVSLVWPFRVKSYADGLTMPMIINSIYAITQTLGLDWNFTGMNGNDASSYLENEINSWLAGQTIFEKFGTEAVRLELGKYIVPATLYNGIVDFLTSFGAKNLNYSGNNSLIYVHLGDWHFVPLGLRQETATAAGIYFLRANTRTGDSTEIKVAQWANYREPTNDGLSVGTEGSIRNVYGLYSYNEGATRVHNSAFLGYVDTANQKTIDVDVADYTAPTVIDPSQSWVGQFDGVPDTNLDDLIDGALDDLADNNLVVDGEVIDTPVPPPTPVPVDPDTPLSDVPWGGLDDALEGIDTNLDNLYNQGLEEIDKIGEAQDAITDAIGDNAEVISGAIEQAISDVETAIGEQTETLNDTLTETAEGVQDIVDALQPGQITPQQFDLRRLFPFCIPFDIHNLLQKFDAEPVAPHVQLPFVIQSIGFSYTFDLDFSAFNSVAAIMRTVEFIVFAIGLAWATSKVIKW